MHIAVIGAGPKGIAVAVRAACLRATGADAPDVTVMEPHQPGHHWTRQGGWTDGFHRLGTSPLKDLGFPYREQDDELRDALRNYSWHAFLADTDRYDEWVDRGMPAPRHALWAEYLGWALDRSGVDHLRSAVEQLDLLGQGWSVTVSSGQRISADAIMVTGFGAADAKLMANCVAVNHLWEGPTNWSAALRVGVIGSGETAGSALATIDQLHPEWSVTVVSNSQSIFSRGEGYLENRLYSDPGERWSLMSESERCEFIRRTDRAVVSQAVQRQIQSGLNFHHIPGYVREVAVEKDGTKRMVLDDQTLGPFDLVIDGRGGSATWFRPLLHGKASAAWEEYCAGKSLDELSRHIGWNLQLEGFPAPLVIPNLAAISQGPGFSNLSCLGALAARVLTPSPSSAVGDAA